jgi:hypothetical protein
MITVVPSFRWSNYFFRRSNEFHTFWEEYLASGERDILFILGLGFDPRMCNGLEALSMMGGKGKRDCVVIELDEGPNSPSLIYANFIDGNKRRLANLFGEGSKISKNVPMWSRDDRRIGSQNAANVFNGLNDFAGYTDLIIDVSAMPRGIYFPLIGKILYLIDSSEPNTAETPNVHVIVSENAELDSKIIDQGIDEDASYMPKFTGRLDAESASNSAKIWIPILGEEQKRQLELIYDLVLPDEICPMLPMPSVNPRRTDDLLLEYREFLFDRLNVDKMNFIYVAEQNPFQVYREIHRAVLHYNRSLNPLGGCRVIISALSSKLLSMGALLAAYELKNHEPGVGIAHVETQGYRIEGVLDIEKELSKTDLSTLWLTGECYAR